MRLLARLLSSHPQEKPSVLGAWEWAAEDGRSVPGMVAHLEKGWELGQETGTYTSQA